MTPPQPRMRLLALVEQSVASTLEGIAMFVGLSSTLPPEKNQDAMQGLRAVHRPCHIEHNWCIVGFAGSVAAHYSLEQSKRRSTANTLVWV